ncbi:MAG: sulfur oxidation c-type cytochrome SoxX [Hylemonella sp.]|nr:sulfur oxidation c-type cytochrome SoxX [Hylemonella sp.]MDH5708599.1 sulfur oxidation c-type cytochrome SoxX [Hylemonella sp.]
MKKTFIALALPAAVLALQACTMSSSASDPDKMTAEVIKSSFVDRGIAKLDRLNPDPANAACAAAEVAGQPIDANLAKSIEEANLKSVQWPSDGKFLGDWKQGEKIAQSGKGMTWKDKLDSVNGGNCYNCHQISKQEISFGTIGPSLYNYGKLRGVTDPNSAASKAIVEYTWGKIWNPRAYSACSQMPRAGHNGVLTQAQVQHIMALLLDPQSPVNQ